MTIKKAHWEHYYLGPVVLWQAFPIAKSKYLDVLTVE